MELLLQNYYKMLLGENILIIEEEHEKELYLSLSQEKSVLSSTDILDLFITFIKKESLYLTYMRAMK